MDCKGLGVGSRSGGIEAFEIGWFDFLEIDVLFFGRKRWKGRWKVSEQDWMKFFSLFGVIPRVAGASTIHFHSPMSMTSSLIPCFSATS